MKGTEFKIFDLGLVEFKKAWEFQKELFGTVKNNSFNGALVLCRHYPVITMGRQAKQENIKVAPVELEKMGIAVYRVERGGDATYHGPGQLTAYPVMNLDYLKKDIHFFLRKLEEVAISFLSEFGVKGARRDGLTGVWAEKEKIASIGIAIKNWITFHGISINIKKADLENFGLINPCGMDIKMTSLETLLKRDVEVGSVGEIFVRNFKNTLSIN
jgi:lipoate-protein ligase B